MKYINLTILLLIISTSILGQKKIDLQKDYDLYFKEVSSATKKTKQLWNKDLYGPILLIDTKTREIIANIPDSASQLKSSNNNTYTGIFPENKNIANTSIYWNGTNWAMIMLPLPENKYDRISLIAHELFHVSQPSLGFELKNSGCNHLDNKDGRIYLRLELEALKKAASSTSKAEMHQHLTNAFTFRKYRQSLFPNSEMFENDLEMNEGIAEYTGETTGGRPESQKAKHFTENINQFLNNPSFVRSFAYQTIPIHGYLLDKSQKGWNRKISTQTNLTDFFIDAFKITIPINLENTITNILGSYNGETIINAETKREDETKKRIAEYKQKFVVQPHFEIKTEQIQIQFNPTNLMPLEEYGTVYPNMNIIDKWGVLNVTNGALMSQGWDKISITNPTIIDGQNISGNGWTLKLSEGYIIIINEQSGNYWLQKK